MSVSLKRLVLSVCLWFGVFAMRVAMFDLPLPRRLQDSLFVVALLSVPLAGAVLTIKAALKESREGPYKLQATLAALGALGLAIVGLGFGLLVRAMLIGHAGDLDRTSQGP